MQHAIPMESVAQGGVKVIGRSRSIQRPWFATLVSGEEGKGWVVHRRLAAAAWAFARLLHTHSASVYAYRGLSPHLAGHFVVTSIPFLLAAAI
jgi:hypothetical protein